MSTFRQKYQRQFTGKRHRRMLGMVSLLWLIWGGMLPLPAVQAVQAVQAEHIVLVVLEGIKSSAIQNGAAPHIAKFAQEGVASWSAQSITPPLTVSAMASLITGLPVEKHRITADWEHYDFARSFMRSPTVFDYMDLAGGRDTGVFLMDERLYQLIRPEIYVDSQVCGYTKPQCTPETVSAYIKDFLVKVTSGEGHGFRLFGVPNLLVTHFPTAARIGQKYGWDSPKYSAAVTAIDNAVDQIKKNYQEIGVLDRTMFIVTGLNSGPIHPSITKGKEAKAADLDPTVPWIAWGANVKHQHPISQRVTLLDTAATIMYALGLDTHTEWDSQAITGIFQSIPKRQTTENELEKIYR